MIITQPVSVEPSNSELISSVLSSALWCEDHRCDPINVSELVRISVSHRPVTVSVLETSIE